MPWLNDPPRRVETVGVVFSANAYRPRKRRSKWVRFAKAATIGVLLGLLAILLTSLFLPVSRNG